MREKLSRTEEELQEIKPRLKWLLLFLIGAGVLLVGRLIHLQLIHGQSLRKYSNTNILKKIKIPAPRGRIFDRQGRLLVDNLPGLQLSITPQYTRDLKATARAIARITKDSPTSIIQKVKHSEKEYGPFRSVPIKQYLSLNAKTLNEIAKLKLLKWDHTGVDMNEIIVRDYILKKNGAQLFGYLSEISPSQLPLFNKKYGHRFRFRPGDKVGQSGLESAWEFELRGRDGSSVVEVDVYNRKSSSFIVSLLDLTDEQQTPHPGKNLSLTIDKHLQEKAYAAFDRQDKRGTRRGSALVMKTNGEILAWVVRPSYDPNIFSKKITTERWHQLSTHPEKPLRNKIIQEHYPPGSIFKPIVALAALQEQTITPETLINSPSRLIFRGRSYHDHNKTGHGLLHVSKAIEKSANVFFYQMGLRLGMEKMAPYARLLNLGQKTHIQLEGEEAGLVPDPEWKKKHTGQPWWPGENLSHAIGQGFLLVTPLQMTVAYNAIATYGKIVKPFIVKQIEDPQNNKNSRVFQPQVKKDISGQIEVQHFALVQESLRQVVQGPEGTARWWKVPHLEMAGKTGTSQVRAFSKQDIYTPCENRPLKQRHHGWFVAFAPAHQPEITVTVLTEHSCSGGGGSAPLARDIIQAYFKNKNLNPPPPQKDQKLKTLFNNHSVRPGSS